MQVQCRQLQGAGRCRHRIAGARHVGPHGSQSGTQTWQKKHPISQSFQDKEPFILHVLINRAFWTDAFSNHRISADPKCSAILMSSAKNTCLHETDTQPRKPTRAVYTAGYVRPVIGSLFRWGKHSFHRRNGSAMRSRPTYFWDTPLITFPGIRYKRCILMVHKNTPGI